VGTLADMSSEVAPVQRKLPWGKIAVVVVMLAAGGLFLLHQMQINPRELMDRGMETIRDAGPWVFFTAATLLPALGVPTLPFLLTAGPAFATKLGMGAVIALSLAALVANMALTYLLARRALRPLLENLMKRLGYKLPEVDSENTTDLVMLLRLTPGIPFFVQNYLLGLAEMPFVKYMLISCLISCPQNVAFVLFGDALVQGKGKMALIAGGLIAAAIVATRFARKHYAKKKTTV
jgi:uncharacterized membrane protein YdjX (TVP38/TMEM64 family)